MLMLMLMTELIIVLSLKADISSAIAFHQSNWRNCELCVYLYAENGAMLLVGI